MPRVSSIQVYPVKALDALPLRKAKVLASGALEFDRRWALKDRNGKFVNGKSHASIHRLRSEFDMEAREILIDGRVFSLVRQQEELARFISDRIDTPVELQENATGGFPDDNDAPGPTLISQASLETVGSWFDLTLEEVRRRFRVNVEIGDAVTFWEDAKYGESVRLGDVNVFLTNPCARCPVPTRDPSTGIAMQGFQQKFMELRKDQFPAWGKPEQFTHYYRLTANTRIASVEAGKVIRIGDIVEG